MPSINLTEGDDTRLLIDPGQWTINGLGGTDSIDLGRSLRSSYEITQAADGAIHVDSISSASGVGGGLNLIVRNIEILYFDTRRELLDLRTLFGDTLPPSVTITSNSPGTALGNVSYSLLFSEPVSAPDSGAFVVTNGSVLSVSGSGVNYQVLVAPASHTEGFLGFSLKSAAVADASGNLNAQASAAAQPIDTLAPAAIGFSPAAHTASVAPGSSIVVSFSELLRLGSGNVVLRDGAGAVVASYAAASSTELSLSGATLTINPAVDLAFGTSYSLQFTPGVTTDLIGNGWAGATGYAFSTAVDPANPRLSGSLGNDRFIATAGTLLIDGLAGLDTLSFAQQRGGYSVTSASGTFSVQALDHSSATTISHVERLKFADQSLALDLEPGANAGRVAQILGAVFGPASVGNREYVGIGLQLLDGGMGYEALVQLALDARLGAGASHGAVVNLLYSNVVGAPPSAADQAYFVGLLDDQVFTTATLGVLAADHALNQTHIDLVGLAQTGLAYLGA